MKAHEWNRMLKKFNRRGFVVAGSKEEAVALRQTILGALNGKVDVVNFGSPHHWFVFKTDVLDRWIELGFLQRKDGNPIGRL
jgi:hypothetical protein